MGRTYVEVGTAVKARVEKYCTVILKQAGSSFTMFPDPDSEISGALLNTKVGKKKPSYQERIVKSKMQDMTLLHLYFKFAVIYISWRSQRPYSGPLLVISPFSPQPYCYISPI
jgi:hypothetical protein